MLKYGQTYLKYFGHFSRLCMKGIITMLLKGGLYEIPAKNTVQSHGF